MTGIAYRNALRALLTPAERRVLARLDTPLKIQTFIEKLPPNFELKGEMLSMPAGQGFSIYSLAAVLPLLAAKQRPTDRNDWMTSDAEIACPDPNCASRLRIVRTGKRRFSHAETTAVPLPKENDQR